MRFSVWNTKWFNKIILKIVFYAHNITSIQSVVLLNSLLKYPGNKKWLRCKIVIFQLYAICIQFGKGRMHKDDKWLKLTFLPLNTTYQVWPVVS